MRGKGNSAATFRITGGITPAYAGKRLIEVFMHRSSEDHPRLCGEKFDVIVHTIAIIRITPAYAGKRLIEVFMHRSSEDHPRLCGEKFDVIVHTIAIIRITPAYAGKRLS